MPRSRQIQVRVAMIDGGNPIAYPLNPRRRRVKNPAVHFLALVLTIRIARASDGKPFSRERPTMPILAVVLDEPGDVFSRDTEWFYNAPQAREFHLTVGLTRSQNGNTWIQLCSRMSFRLSNFRNWNVIKCWNRQTLELFYSALEESAPGKWNKISSTLFRRSHILCEHYLLLSERRARRPRNLHKITCSCDVKWHS